MQDHYETTDCRGSLDREFILEIRPVGRTDLRRAEKGSVLIAGLLFFLLLTAIMILRPVREALGLARGIENIRHLFLITVGSTLLLAPLFGRVVARVPRHRLLAVSFRACAVTLLSFLVGLALLPASVQEAIGSVYYVFHSVFNLFVVSLFWAFMADHIRLAQSKRVFPAIAMGGSLGAIVGSLVSWQLAEHVGIPWLFAIAAILLEVAVWVAAWFGRVRAAFQPTSLSLPSLGGNAWAGVQAVVKSSYLRGIAFFVVLVGMVSTFLYFTGLRLVAASSHSTLAQTALFAHINVWTQVATLFAQAFIAARIMRWAGVGAALAILPALAAGGFAVLALVPTLAAFTVINAAFRATQQGITRPARETLFTVLHPEENYKAKPFVDTFGYRTGDAGAALLDGGLGALSPGFGPLAFAVFALAIIWAGFSFLLGRAQSALAQANGPMD